MAQLKPRTQKVVDAVLILILIADAIVMYQMFTDNDPSANLSLAPAAKSFSAASQSSLLPSKLESTLSAVPLQKWRGSPSDEKPPGPSQTLENETQTQSSPEKTPGPSKR